MSEEANQVVDAKRVRFLLSIGQFWTMLSVAIVVASALWRLAVLFSQITTQLHEIDAAVRSCMSREEMTIWETHLRDSNRTNNLIVPSILNLRGPKPPSTTSY
jgi:hypothetical protein